MSDELTSTPTRVETVWGVELDDFGSADYYPSEAEAREASEAHGLVLIKTVTEFFAPAIEEQKDNADA